MSRPTTRGNYCLLSQRQQLQKMEYLYSSQYAASVSVGEDSAVNDFLDEVCFCFCCMEVELLKY